MSSVQQLQGEMLQAWRLLAGILALQLVGALALVLSDWSPPPFTFRRDLSLAPDVLRLVLQAWFGAAFAAPIGLLLGQVWQRRAPQEASGRIAKLCAAMAVLLPLLALAWAAAAR